MLQWKPGISPWPEGIIAAFPERLNDLQKIPDYLAELGDLTKRRDANIIKLPNISASNPQLQAAIEELKKKGYDLPDYPEEPANESERDIKQRYDLIKGSAVNPVLREGNSDRRAALAVKAYAHKHPHRMGVWSAESKSHVAHMQEGDFYASEKSVTLGSGDQLSNVHTDDDGTSQTLLSGIEVEADEVVDAAFMSVEALRRFYDEQLQAGKGAEGPLVTAPQSNHDEGVGSNFVWACSESLLCYCYREAQRGARGFKGRF